VFTYLLPLAVSTDSSSDIWTAAKAIMGDFYGKLLGISTLVGVVSIAICLIWRMVSANPKTVEVCNGWIKRVAITWFILNLLGFIMNYIQPLVKNGQYSYGDSAMVRIIVPLAAQIHFISPTILSFIK
jgi:hypothetical protein